MRSPVFAVLSLISSALQAQSGDAIPEVFDLASVQQQPSFAGGQEGMMHFISGAVHYPDSAMAHKIEGKVYVEFTVEMDGRVNDVKVKRGVNPYLDAEAVRVVKSMPPWSPGLHEGKPVRVKFILPLVFKLT